MATQAQHINQLALNREGWSHDILQLQSDALLLVISQCQYDHKIDAIPKLDSLIISHPDDYKFVDADVLSNPDLNVIFSWLSMSGLDPQTLDNRLDSLNNKTGLLTKTLCNWSYESLPILENKVLFRNAAQKSREPGHDDLFKNIIMNENNFYTEQISNNDQFAASRSRMRFGADIDSALTRLLHPLLRERRHSNSIIHPGTGSQSGQTQEFR